MSKQAFALDDVFEEQKKLDILNILGSLVCQISDARNANNIIVPQNFSTKNMF